MRSIISQRNGCKDYSRVARKRKKKGMVLTLSHEGGGDIAVTIQSRPGNRKTDNFLYEEIDTI